MYILKAIRDEAFKGEVFLYRSGNFYLTLSGPGCTFNNGTKKKQPVTDEGDLGFFIVHLCTNKKNIFGKNKEEYVNFCCPKINDTDMTCNCHEPFPGDLLKRYTAFKTLKGE